MIVYYFDARLSCFFCGDLGSFCLSWVNPNKFLAFFPRSWKDVRYLAKFAKINCHDDGKKNQNSKKFLHKKTKTSTTGEWSCLHVLFRFISCSLEERSPILVFVTKSLQKWHLSLISFCAKIKIRKAESSQINFCFHPMFVKWALVNEPTLVHQVFEMFLNQLVANLP